MWHGVEAYTQYEQNTMAHIFKDKTYDYYYQSDKTPFVLHCLVIKGGDWRLLCASVPQWQPWPSPSNRLKNF